MYLVVTGVVLATYDYGSMFDLSYKIDTCDVDFHNFVVLVSLIELQRTSYILILMVTMPGLSY